MDIEKIWNKVKGEGGAEYANADPDFTARLAHAAREARQGRATGIAGLEKFEEAIAKDAGVALSQSGVDAASTPGSPSVVGDQPEDEPKATKKGSKAKALKDAEAAGERVEADEVNSPDFPSAARPLAAEVPGTHPEKKAVKKSAKKSAKK